MRTAYKAGRITAAIADFILLCLTPFRKDGTRLIMIVSVIQAACSVALAQPSSYLSLGRASSYLLMKDASSYWYLPVAGLVVGGVASTRNILQEANTSDGWVVVPGGDLDKRAALYSRVSSLKQARTGHSMEAQERLLLERAKELGVGRYRLFRDPGKTSKVGVALAKRRLGDILSLAKKGEINYLLVADSERLGRWAKAIQRWEWDVADCGVKIYDLEQEIDVSTSEGSKKNFDVLNDAEQSNKTRSKLVERVKKDRFRQKIWKKPIPPGYAKQANGEWIEKDPRYQAVVEYVHQELPKIRKYSLVFQKASALYGHILPHKLTLSEIKQMASNPIYKGLARYSKGSNVVVDVDAFVSKEIWEATQKVVRMIHDKHKTRRPPRERILEQNTIEELRYQDVELVHLGCGGFFRGNGTKKETGQQIIDCDKCGVQRVLPSYRGFGLKWMRRQVLEYTTSTNSIVEGMRSLLLAKLDEAERTLLGESDADLNLGGLTRFDESIPRATPLSKNGQRACETDSSDIMRTSLAEGDKKLSLYDERQARLSF